MVTVNVGTLDPPVVAPDVGRTLVAACHPQMPGLPAPQPWPSFDRGAAVTAMSHALTAFLLRQYGSGRVAGVIGIGGSGGTGIVTQAMRALPVGLPKLMVSTLASGNTASYVGLTDITMMHSVVDIAGLNAVSRRVLANAAAAMAGMVGYASGTRSRQADRGDDHVRCDHAMRDSSTPGTRGPRLRLSRLPRHRHRRQGDGNARRGRSRNRRARHHDHRGRRSPRGRDLGLRSRALRADSACACAVRRVVGRSRHGQLRRARNRPRYLSRSSLSRAQRPRYAHADHAS